MKKKIHIRPRLNSAEKEGVLIEEQKKRTEGRPTGKRLVRIRHKSLRKEHLVTKEEKNDKLMMELMEAM